MNFNTFLFYPFLAAVVIVNFLLPRRFRWAWLLIASFVFYGLLDARFLAVLLACTAIAYTGGRVIDRSAEEKRKKAWTAGAVGLLVGILFLFKYLGFFFDILNSAASAAGLRFHLRGIAWFYPAGISFYALQAVSYLLDVFNGRVRAEKNPGVFALYLSFFPQLLIGPIERFEPFGIQIREPAPFEYQRFVNGLLRIGWGLFKKVVIADRLAVIADTVFAEPSAHSGYKMLLGVLAFAVQIYYDFSAYTDIAIGAASMVGIRLSENFKHPYRAESVADFWRRWHMTFSGWLRDYIFLPMTMRFRRKKPRELWTALVIMVTFLVSGLWHGADWTFIVWGALHGFYQAAGTLTGNTRKRIADKLKVDRTAYGSRLARMAWTFLLVTVAWVFFKAKSLPDAFYILRSIATLKDAVEQSAWIITDGSLGLDKLDLIMAAVMLFAAVVVNAYKRKHDLAAAFARQPAWFRWAAYAALFFAITVFGYYGEVSAADFVYFQF